MVIAREITSAIGSNEKAPITGEEIEREMFNERFGTRRRVAVDSRISEFQLFDLNRYWL